MLGRILGPLLITGPLPDSVAISECAQAENPRLPLAFKCLRTPIEIIDPNADASRLNKAGIYFRAYHETSLPQGLSAQTQIVSLHGDKNWQVFFALLRWSRERTIEAEAAQKMILANRAAAHNNGTASSELLSGISNETVLQLLKKF